MLIKDKLLLVLLALQLAVVGVLVSMPLQHLPLASLWTALSMLPLAAAAYRVLCYCRHWQRYRQALVDSYGRIFYYCHHDLVNQIQLLSGLVQVGRLDRLPDQIKSLAVYFRLPLTLIRTVTAPGASALMELQNTCGTTLDVDCRLPETTDWSADAGLALIVTAIFSCRDNSRPPAGEKLAITLRGSGLSAVLELDLPSVLWPLPPGRRRALRRLAARYCWQLDVQNAPGRCIFSLRRSTASFTCLDLSLT